MDATLHHAEGVFEAGRATEARGWGPQPARWDIPEHAHVCAIREPSGPAGERVGPRRVEPRPAGLAVGRLRRVGRGRSRSAVRRVGRRPPRCPASLHPPPLHRYRRPGPSLGLSVGAQLCGTTGPSRGPGVRPERGARAALTGLCGVPNRFESALRGWARHNGAVAAAMARVDQARIQHLATALSPLVDDPRMQRELAVGAVNAVVELQRLRPRPGHDRYIAALREFAASLPALHDWPTDPHRAAVGSNAVPLLGPARRPRLGLAGTRS